MNIKDWFNPKGIVVFLFCCWAEVLIFSISLFMSAFLWNMVKMVIKLWKSSFYYSLSGQDTMKVKIFLLFVTLGIIQYFFSGLISKLGKRRIYLFLYILDACAIASLFINSMIMRTDLRDYRFLWLGVFIVMIVSSLSILEKRGSKVPIRPSP